MVNFPASLDSLSNPSPTTKRNATGFELSSVISTLNDIAEALEAKLGTGADTAAANELLVGTGAGATAFRKLLNADVDAAAAIAYSKLALATSIVNADISASAAIAYSKLALTGAILAADLASQPAARAYHNAAQSIANSTVTTLAFNSERFDTNTIHDTSSNNSRLTCQTAGRYQITANVEFASGGGNRRLVQILLNGATAIGRVDLAPQSGSASVYVVSTVYQLAVSDYVEVQVFQDSGGALNVTNTGNYSPEFMMARVG